MTASDVLAGTSPWAIEYCDVLDGLRSLPNGSIHSIVTSPPYLGLRDYGLPPQIWGGDPECEHDWAEKIPVSRRHATRGESMGVGGGKGDDRPLVNQHQKQGATSQRVGRKNVEAQRNDYADHGSFCQGCGAWRGCLGLEPDADLFLEHLVAVFRECKRVLRRDGTLWLNMGDSYTGSGKGRNADGQPNSHSSKQTTNHGTQAGTIMPSIGSAFGLPAKSLLMMPAQLAIALQRDGWVLRSKIVWAKPSPMPESATDRPTRSYEEIFLFARSGRYFYDSEAERLPPGQNTHARSGKAPIQPLPKTTEPGRGIRNNNTFGAVLRGAILPNGANLRDVWTFPGGGSGDYEGEHFATFPPELPKRCIALGTSEHGCCPDCGAQWRRIVEMEPVPAAVLAQFQASRERTAEDHGRGDGFTTRKPNYQRQKLGEHWEPGCGCALEPLPAIVLDPFSGSGTTVMQARRMNRRSIGFELNPADVDASRRRVQQDRPMFNQQLEAERAI